VEKKKLIRQRHSQQQEEEEEEGEFRWSVKHPKVFSRSEYQKGIERKREKERVWSACHGLVLLPNKKLLASLVAGDLISPALLPAPVLVPKP
jgi:hypothetical protein